MTLRELLAHPAVRGVAIGNCVDGSEWNRKHLAHAHYGGRFNGWVCIERPSGLTSAIFVEELSHLVAITDGIHDATFRRARREIRARYRKRPTRRPAK